MTTPHSQDTQVRYSATVTKFDRKTFKSRVYVLVVTNAGILILYKDSLKLNFRLDFSHLLVCVRRVCVCVCACVRVMCVYVRARVRDVCVCACVMRNKTRRQQRE